MQSLNNKMSDLHPRVHVSPINMIVAVACALSDPAQHSPIFGQRASSHTFNSNIISFPCTLM